MTAPAYDPRDNGARSYDVSCAAIRNKGLADGSLTATGGPVTDYERGVFHPVANVFPMLGQAELAELAADIKANGQRRAIVRHEGKILDGRNRWRAARLAGLAPRFEEFAGDDPVGFVISENIHRRHLTLEQRAMAAAELANMKAGRPAGGAETVSMETVSLQDAADRLHVGRASAARARTVLERGSETLQEMLRSGQISITVADTVSRLSPEEQDKLTSEGANAVRRSSNQIRAEKRSARMADQPELGEGERLGALSGFPVDALNWFATIDERAAAVLDPHLPRASRFVEPCAGDAILTRQLEALGHVCAAQYDLAPRDEAVVRRDALDLGEADLGGADLIITNPPWDRDKLHPLIAHLSALKPTWLLFDARWKHSLQAGELIETHCTHIVSIGRLRWDAATKTGGMSDHAWYRFDAAKAPGWPAFIPRQSKQETADG